jgi:hypothetical protein
MKKCLNKWRVYCSRVKTKFVVTVQVAEKQKESLNYEVDELHSLLFWRRVSSQIFSGCRCYHKSKHGSRIVLISVRNVSFVLVTLHRNTNTQNIMLMFILFIVNMRVYRLPFSNSIFTRHFAIEPFSALNVCFNYNESVSINNGKVFNQMKCFQLFAELLTFPKNGSVNWYITNNYNG